MPIHDDGVGFSIKRVALVTGCGREVGIGGTTARRLAGLGFRIVATDLPDSDGWPATPSAGLLALVDGIVAGGGEAVAVAGDITSPESAQSIVDFAVSQYGRIDVLVNNAAAPPGADRADLADVEPEDWDFVLRVNLRGPYLVCRSTIPIMRAQGYGRIVNIASMSGVISAPHLAAYSASKAGVIGMTRSLAMDVARQGITVNAVCPGLVATNRTGVSTPGSTPAALLDLGEQIPLGRVAGPDDISRVVAFFASDAARYVTGQYLAVDGGGPTTYELPPLTAAEAQ